VLRDSGSLQSLISREKLSSHDFVDTGESRLIKGVTGDVVRVPLVEVDLQSKYGTGKYLFGLVDRLPDVTFDALIGNDLDPPMIDEVPVSVGVVTRSQTAALKQCNSADLPAVPDSVSNSDTFPLNVIDQSADDLVDVVLSSTDELIKPQHDDSKLSHLFELAKDKSLISDDLPVFYLEKGILVRSWRDKELPTLSGTEFSQIVVPKPLRAKILKQVHDIPAAAHLGMIKTKKRLEQHFYWPAMSEDIKLYIRICDVCHRLGKGGKPAPAPLHNLPVIAEPFSRIAIDIVGPLPVCRDTGSRFILTIVDHCTHFPEALPLVTHEAVDVAKALVSVFSHFGFAREILSDCGSEFMSQLTKVLLEEFGI